MAFEPITAEEAVRRIQERDHVVPAGQPQTMPFEHEQGLIYLLRTGRILAGFDSETRELAFTKGSLS